MKVSAIFRYCNENNLTFFGHDVRLKHKQSLKFMNTSASVIDTSDSTPDEASSNKYLYFSGNNLDQRKKTIILIKAFIKKYNIDLALQM